MNYYHLRKDKTNKGGTVSIMYDCELDNELKAYKISYSVACCSPKDSFSRKIADNILRGRYEADKTVTIYHPEDLKPDLCDNVLNVAKIVLIDIMYGGYDVVLTVPKWAKKLIKANVTV